MWRNLVFILCVIQGTRQLSFTDFEVPDALELGEDAELQCGYDLSPGENENDVLVKWWFTSLEGDRYALLYQRIGGRTPAVGKKDVEITSKDDIKLVNLEAEDTGTYTCEVGLTGGAEIRKSDLLVAYSKGTGPNLTISTVEDGPDEDEDEDVVISCEASEVAPLPELSITVNKEEINTTETRYEVSDKPGLYFISVNTTVSKSEVDGAEVACELFYKNANISHPAYVDIETYDPSGDGASSLQITWLLLGATFISQLYLFH